MASTLLTGANLAESYYAAQPVLSWMSVLVGDPLYRPYACFSSEESTSPSKSVWTDYRRIVLAHGGNVLEATDDLKARAEQGGQSLYLEALGNAQMDEGKLTDAEASFHRASELSHESVVQFRLLLETARCLEKEGSADKGAALLRQGLIRFNSSAQRGLLLAWISRLDPIKTATTAPSTAVGGNVSR
jgi:tetratricopeptide (TPR) repeat protein